MSTPGFIARAFLIQSARYAGVFGNRPAAIVVREPKCVRFGPITPIATGLPAIAWQPMQRLGRKDLPPALRVTRQAGVNLSPRESEHSGPRSPECCSRGKM